MNISGEKIILRAISLCDSQLLLDLINDSETEQMLGGSSFPVSLESQNKWISELEKNQYGVLRCIVATKDNIDEGLGTVILSDIDYKNGTAQIHIKMDKDKGRGKGYGIDAVKAIVSYAFDEMRLNCIYADILSYNTISANLFKKAGFVLDGVMRSRIFKNGKYIDLHSYSILKDEYYNGL